MLNQRAHVLRRVAMTHTLTASLGIGMLGLTVLFVLTRLNVGVFGIGIDSLILFGVFLGGLYLLRMQGRRSGSSIEVEAGQPDMSLWRVAIGFIISLGILWGAAIFLVSSSKEIAEMTGVGTAFFGASAFAIVTSLPEVVATMAAVRMGAYDLAVGNLFGSNVFNVMALALNDVFYTKGYFLSDISLDMALVGMIALLLTCMALIGQLARVERRLWFVEIDALFIIVGYGLGMYLLFTKGISLG
jgi:cation:H+ antiporter